jgi:MFS transporter, ACS family, tartrate transporter
VSTPTASLPVRARRRITRRLIPFLFLLYVIAYLDRVNVSYAALDMTRELHFSDDVFGFGAGIFFIGYVLLEIPGTLLVEVWSARKWIARIMISWGLVAALTGLIHTAPQFYWARFLLGVAEAGFFPGVIVYLTHWYRAEDRAKAVAMFMSAIPLSQVLGAPISSLLLQIHWFGYSGWRWLLILEGVPALILGFVTLFYLSDRPKDAKWLADDERDWITGELERERREKLARAPVSVWRALSHPTVILLTLVYFFSNMSSYGLQLFLPKMVQKLSGFSSVETTLITAIPNLAAWPAMLLVGWSSDRTGERRWHCAVPLFLVGVSLWAAQRSSAGVVFMIAMFTLASMGINARLPSFWALPSAFLGGTTAAASIGLINCLGNLGGFAGPSIVGFLSNRTGTYTAGVWYLVGASVLAGILVLLVRGRRTG